MRQGIDSGMHSPRPETPEPGSAQGRRNAGVQLLDGEGGISDQVRRPSSVTSIILIRHPVRAVS
jgi:GTPases - Sulfate adenylate transferase subunit 1